MPIRLERRPLELLILLVRRRGELIARDEIVRLLWGEEVFVEAEAGIHTAIRKIRRALNDPPKGASYIETVPGKGYRFIAPLQRESPPRYTTVAVLPVHALDRSPEGQYLAEGITEEVIAALGQVSPDVLRVIGRTTMMRYRETEESLAAIGRTLRAEFLVESSMRSDGAQLRLTSRLVRATDQIQLWCASFDGDCNKSVLQFQRELSQAVAAES
jgi:TolB-like protein